MAVIEAILSLTLPDKVVATDAIARIRSALATEELLGLQEEARLSSLVRRPFQVYGEHRVQLSGQEINVSAQVARGLAMVFHEMTTNCVKYEALNKDDGRVHVEWTASNDSVVLTWTERDGPIVKVPEKHNFGTRLITSTMKRIGGTIKAEFQPTGLHAVLFFPSKVAPDSALLDRTRQR